MPKAIPDDTHENKRRKDESLFFSIPYTDIVPWVVVV
jgi:hypothetical protein